MSPGKQKLLVVEDEAALRNALVETFMREGFDVEEAGDGKTGLEQALNFRPDIILLDIVLPHLDGVGVLRALRNDPWGKTVPVVLLTNLSADDKLTEAVTKYEPAFYLIKSEWKLADVVAKVRERLENRG